MGVVFIVQINWRESRSSGPGRASSKEEHSVSTAAQGFAAGWPGLRGMSSRSFPPARAVKRLQKGYLHVTRL